MQPHLIQQSDQPAAQSPISTGARLPVNDVDLVKFIEDRFRTREVVDDAGCAIDPKDVLYTLSGQDLLEAFREFAGHPVGITTASCTVSTDTNSAADEVAAGAPTLAESLTTLFHESGAVNYIEIAVDTKDEQIGDLLLTLQRRKGKTPHQLRLEAEVKLAEVVIGAAAAPSRDEVMSQLATEFEAGLSAMVSNMTTCRGESGDVDYVEMQLTPPDPEIGRLAVCIRRIGAKSPHALYLEAKAALAEVRANRNPASQHGHSDDLAVDRFAAAMKSKLARARGKGPSDWSNPRRVSIEWLQYLLVQHLEKGDLLDVGSFCMMLHQRGAPRLQIQAVINETPPGAPRSI